MRLPLRGASDDRDSMTAQSSARAGSAKTHALIVEHANRRTTCLSGVGGGAGGCGGGEKRRRPSGAVVGVWKTVALARRKQVWMLANPCARGAFKAQSAVLLFPPHMRLPRVTLLVLAILACRDASPPAPQHNAPAAAASLAATPAVLPASFSESAMPDGPLGLSIRRGLALVEHTPDSLAAYVGGNLRCTSCHLDRGLRPNAAPLSGVHNRFPKYIDRSGAVVPIEDRVNYCFTRSLAGRALPPRSREMVDIVAYLAFISQGTPAGGHVPGEGMPKMTALASDSARGHALFTANCARCHGGDGAGIALVPALWGARSYSVGASMARVERAASFIRHNMPFDKPGTLTDQQAYDVAAYVNAHARPDSPGKEQDWPNGGAPADVPYATKGRAPEHLAPVLPRRNADGAIVPAPVSARRAGA